MKTVILLLCLVVRCSALDANFVRAIHQVESSGKIGAIKGDNSKALGPLQIHYPYWKDATDFDKSIGGKYEDVAKLDYATKVMASYLRRYCPKAVSSGNYEILARVHNGGPSGASKVATINYWKKVQTELDKAKK
jgi:hypothetical protein